jgi:hypothetical protein
MSDYTQQLTGEALRLALMRRIKQNEQSSPPASPQDKLTAPRVITVRYDKVYGEKVIRPVCIDACLFAKMLDQKTLTNNDIANIKLLGFKVLTEVQAPKEL